MSYKHCQKINKVELTETKKVPKMRLMLIEDGKTITDLKDLKNAIIIFDDPEQDYKTERQISFGEIDELVRLVDNTMDKIKNKVEFIQARVKQKEKAEKIIKEYREKNEKEVKEFHKKAEESLPAGFLLIGIRPDINPKIVVAMSEFMQKIKELGFIIDTMNDIPNDIFKRDTVAN